MGLSWLLHIASIFFSHSRLEHSVPAGFLLISDSDAVWDREGKRGREKVWRCQGTRNEKTHSDREVALEREKRRARDCLTMCVCVVAYVCLIRLSSGNSWIIAWSSVCPTKEELFINKTPVFYTVSCEFILCSILCNQCLVQSQYDRCMTVWPR